MRRIGEFIATWPKFGFLTSTSCRSIFEDNNGNGINSYNQQDPVQ